MAVFIVFGQTADNALYIDHVTAADVATAQTIVTNALAKGLGINNGAKSQVSYAIIQAAAAGTINPT